MDTFFIFGAKYLLLASVIIFLVLLLRTKDRKRFVIFSLSTFAVAYILALACRAAYFDPRPFVTGGFTPLIPHASDNGFVSDHALLAAAIAAAVSHFKRRPALYLWLIAAAVGLSRVYIGVHHLADIAASIVIAILASLVVRFLMGKKRML
jgi:undecaprenyl-diphosphatase